MLAGVAVGVTAATATQQKGKRGQERKEQERGSNKKKLEEGQERKTEGVEEGEENQSSPQKTVLDHKTRKLEPQRETPTSTTGFLVNEPILGVNLKWPHT
ncbi:hypothetical protein AMTRI_Chr02g255530 [Amborella trichopoda]